MYICVPFEYYQVLKVCIYSYVHTYYYSSLLYKLAKPRTGGQTQYDGNVQPPRSLQNDDSLSFLLGQILDPVTK